MYYLSRESLPLQIGTYQRHDLGIVVHNEDRGAGHFGVILEEAYAANMSWHEAPAWAGRVMPGGQSPRP